jgi:hypothetical protein
MSHPEEGAEKAFREGWLKTEIARIKAGGTIRMRCVMATADRVSLGLCWGDIPEDRAHRGAETCSPECQADRRRLKRWEMAKGSCRYCGHGLSRKEKAKLAEKIPVPGTKEQPHEAEGDGVHIP